MALYLIEGQLVRARNGHHGCEILGVSDVEVFRVTEDGRHGIVAASAAGKPAKKRRRDKRELDVTTLADKGVRRMKDVDTGEERTEPRD